MTYQRYLGIDTSLSHTQNKIRDNSIDLRQSRGHGMNPINLWVLVGMYNAEYAVTSVEYTIIITDSLNLFVC